MHKTTHTQLLIIGGGPGGYTAAFRAADLGQSVTVIDMNKTLGGVCLSRGCIPAKALLHVAKILTDIKEAKDIGIEFGTPQINVEKIREWKNTVVARLTAGLSSLAKQRQVTLVEGKAMFLDSTNVKVDKTDGTTEIFTFDHAILATGAQPANLPFAPASPRVLNSTMALDLDDIPKKLLVIGGGYIGLEMGTIYAGLGSEVSVVEMTPALLPGMDADLVNMLERRLKKTFKTILLSTKVLELKETPNAIAVTLEDKDKNQTSAEFDKVLVAIGRKPNTKDLGLENTKIELTEQGFVYVTSRRKTDEPKIFAIGDITGNPMLAHKASQEGLVAAEVISGKEAEFEPKAIPSVVFTDPEIACCGLTETSAKEQGIEIKVVKFPWTASGRAVTLNRTDGFTKIIVDPQTERILGMAIVGAGAGELISEGVLAVETGAKISDLKETIHPHPTLSETIGDAARMF